MQTPQEYKQHAALGPDALNIIEARQGSVHVARAQEPFEQISRNKDDIIIVEVEDSF